MLIHDATGTGKGLKINQYNQAITESNTYDAIHFHSNLGNAYQLFAPSRTLGGTGEHNILYFKNTSENKSFIITRYLVSWNGGSTNWNRPATIKQYISSGAPSANSTTTLAGNLNTLSGNTAPMTVQYWDGVGTAGMTQVAGTQAGEVIITQGTTIFSVSGSTIIGPSDSVTISFTGQEVGIAAVTVEGYFI